MAKTIKQITKTGKQQASSGSKPKVEPPKSTTTKSKADGK